MQPDAAEGPDVVSGVPELRHLGFEPVEEHKGVVWVGEYWPDEHRRSVPTRESWLEDSRTSGRLRMVRSPWPSWTLRETFSTMWRWLERPGTAADVDPDDFMIGVADFLRWDESEAAKWRRHPQQRAD